VISLEVVVIIRQLMLLVALFIAGLMCGLIYADLQVEQSNSKIQSVSAVGKEQTEKTLPTIFPTEPSAQPSPYDRVKEENIHVYHDKVVIDLASPEWAAFTDTHSMEPVIDASSNAIEIVPKSSDEIHLGDIVSYESEYASGTIIHRIVEIGQDSEGWYCRLKGDNIQSVDPGKVRFDQIRRIVVAIIY
jgi:hypothetical protein